jgi:predicted amidohydrolase
MCIEPLKRSANLARAIERLDQAAELDPVPDLIVLPERSDLGEFSEPPEPALLEPLGGTFTEALAERARALGVYIVAGITDRDGDRLFSASALIDPDGDFLLRHRRIAPDSGDTNTAAPGLQLRVMETSVGVIALLTGLDLWHKPLIESLALMGADLIVVPGGPGGKGHRSRGKKRAVPESLSTVCGDTKTAIVATAAAALPDRASGRSTGPYSFCIDGRGRTAVSDDTGGELMLQAKVVFGAQK